ncbi:MAG: DNA-binding protein [Flavobacteriaceae bacterium]|nr:DNA-binding protein [Flavobacteriaceae bacterium]|tara:strand:+ start:135282 stop:135701 length:420 start_codon:yes stop_codon:yes gene_type:complete
MDIKEGDQVKLFINKETSLGYSVVINQEFEGLLYRNEVFQDIEEGITVDGYVKKIREDGKVDVSLQPQGFRKVIDKDVDTILSKLKESRDGSLRLTDKSSPEAIKFQLQMSKKAFKKAVGNLYKRKMIVLKDDRIELKK